MYLHMLVVREIHSRPPRHTLDFASEVVATRQKKVSLLANLELWVASTLIKTGMAIERKVNSEFLLARSTQAHGVANE